MPETRPVTSRTLTLHSPATSSSSSSTVATYHWPLHLTESWNEAHEIAETVRWVCSDFPELGTAVQNCMINHFDPSSYDSMKMFCEKYNRAVDNIRKLWSGRQPPPCIDVLPVSHHLKHILTQVYNRSVKKPEELNQYEPFSPEVYGETSFELIQEVISITRMTENDVFLDLGSGVGQIVLQVAASVGCKCYGIEKADIPAKYAETMDTEFARWMDFYGKSYGEYELFKGDFMDPKFDEIISSATVLFCNNFAFGPDLNHRLTLKFQNLRDGVKIVSSREFCPLNFRLTERKLSDIGAMMRVVQLSPLKGHVSWTDKPVSYYLHVIDRTVLEEFFLKQKHGESKSEGSITSLSDNEEEEDEDNDTSSTSSASDSASSSSSSSSEDSSLDSTNEDLFQSHHRLAPVEHYHFPPQNLSNRPHPLAEKPPLLDERPHPLSSYRKSMSTSTSSVPKKSTPPVGSTHLPHPPHPHAPQPRRHRNKVDGGGGGGGGRGGGKRKRLSKKQNPLQLQHQLGGVGGVGGSGLGQHSLIDHSSLNKLFDSFREQNEAYLGQLSSSSFAAWLTDAAEKEKMKRKHLMAVIDHLESEVKSLSQETIHSMKKSMLSLGITDLTPEGLLCGAKDIVALNRQLRKEVELLEREVVQLKEQHQAMNGINCHTSSSPPPHPPPAHHVMATVPSTVTSYPLPPPSLPPSLPPLPTTSPSLQLPPPKAMKVSETCELTSSLSSPFVTDDEANSVNTTSSVTPPIAPPTLPAEEEEKEEEPSSHPLPPPPHHHIPPPSMVSILLVEEEGTAERILEISSTSSPVSSFPPPSSLLQYEIRLETIDQAVLELGPFAKEIHQQERLEPVPLGWGEFKKDRGVSVGVAGSMPGGVVAPFPPSVFKSGEIPQVLPTSSLKGVKKGGRRRREDTPTWTAATPPLPPSLGVPIHSVAGGDETLKGAVTPSPKNETPTPSETSSIAEAMLALSHAPPSETQTTPTSLGALPTLRSSTGSVLVDSSLSSNTRSSNCSSNSVEEGSRGRPFLTLSNSLPPPPSLNKLPPPPPSLSIQPLSHSGPPPPPPPSFSIPPPAVSAPPPLSTEPVSLKKDRTGSTSSLKSTSSSVAVVEDSPPPPPPPPPSLTYLQYDASSSNKNTPSVPRSSHRDPAPSRETAPPIATSGNPFLPPSLQNQTDASAVVSFPYPFHYQSLYRAANFYPAANTLTYGASPDSAHSLEAPMRQIIPPYLFRYQYPGAVGTHSLQGNIPLGCVASTPSLPAAFQGTTLSSSPPTHLSAFKTLHQPSFNRSLTPPTLHPLATAQTLDKVPTPTVGDALNPWLFGQYAPAGGVAFPFSVLSQQATPTILAGGLQAPPTNPLEDKRSRGKRSSNEYYQTLHDKSPHELLHRQAFEHAHILSSSSPSSPRLDSRPRGGGAKSDGRPAPRLKIHQMNNEDFQAPEKGGDRRRRRGRATQLHHSKDFQHVTAASRANEVGVVVETPPTPEEDMIDVTSIDPLPHPLLRDRGPSESDQVINIEDSPAPPTSKSDNPRDTTHAVNRTDESVSVTKEVEKGAEPILLSDNEDQVSSEGTVSASPSPRLLSPPVATGHTSFPFSRHDSTAQNEQVDKEQGKRESNIAVGAIVPVTTTTVSMAAVTAVTPEAREVMKSPTPHNRANDDVANTSSYTEKEEYNQSSLPPTITQTHATNKGSSHSHTTATITSSPTTIDSIATAGASQYNTSGNIPHSISRPASSLHDSITTTTHLSSTITTTSYEDTSNNPNFTIDEHYSQPHTTPTVTDKNNELTITNNVYSVTDAAAMEERRERREEAMIMETVRTDAPVDNETLPMDDSGNPETVSRDGVESTDTGRVEVHAFSNEKNEDIDNQRLSTKTLSPSPSPPAASLDPPLPRTTPTRLINDARGLAKEEGATNRIEGERKEGFVPINMSDIGKMTFEYDESENDVQTLDLLSPRSASSTSDHTHLGSDHAHVSRLSPHLGGGKTEDLVGDKMAEGREEEEEEEEEGEILSIEEDEDSIEEQRVEEEERRKERNEEVFQESLPQQTLRLFSTSSSSSSDHHHYPEDRMSLSVDERLSPPLPHSHREAPPTIPPPRPGKERNHYTNTNSITDNTGNITRIQEEEEDEEFSHGKIRIVKECANDSSHSTITDGYINPSTSGGIVKAKKKRALNRDFTKHSQHRAIPTTLPNLSIPSSSSSKLSSYASDIKERISIKDRDKVPTKHSSSGQLHVQHVETKHRHHRHRHHGDRLATPQSRPHSEQRGGSSERKGHRRSPRPRPHPVEDQPTSPHRSHAHHRAKKHSPSEDRTYHKKTSHAHSSAHHHHDHNHCSGRSHSSTPVSDHYESGRGFDKPHLLRGKEPSPNWNSDGQEDGRAWSHHHGDRRKRKGSEGSGEDVKYKKRKHEHHHRTITTSSDDNIRQ